MKNSDGENKKKKMASTKKLKQARVKM